ncbi:hypothetical protein [Acidovorax kalamii]|uniref:hypothetical protein n=1 Tax=Acidovorax kalamii TaxID=2004485 RepID=UPI002091102C|nr:hypothetical protein [Acidovorax kalamii]MCO5355130.1 hypothetical protein [Acidovorax kalamii]
MQESGADEYKTKVLGGILEMAEEMQSQLKWLWDRTFFPEENDPSFDDGIEAVRAHIGLNPERRKKLNALLIRAFNESKFPPELPLNVREICERQPLDYKINAVEVEIRAGLLLGISSVIECKRAVYASGPTNAIYWHGRAAFWSGVVVSASSAQVRDWEKVSKGAKARWLDDPKQVAKQNVRSCWDRWQEKPHQYKSKSAFARAMLDKYEELGSQRVIERWCKEWESALNLQSTQQASTVRTMPA